MNGTLLFSVALVVVSLPASATAQAREVVGTVRETVTGQPIPNAEVRVIGQEGGVCTNALGEYRLRVPAGAARVAAWYHGVLGGLLALTTADTVADFDLEQGMERPQIATAEPLIYVDGVRVSPAGGFEVEGPREILVLNGVEITNVPDRCRESARRREGGDS